MKNLEGDIKACVEYVSSKFVYKEDNTKIFDSWRVMTEKNGKFYGDCEDFSLTVMWHFYGKSLFKFIFFVLIIHKSFIWHVKTKDGVGHAVGYTDSYYFDNWKKTVYSSKEAVKVESKHRFVTPVFPPVSWLYMILGLINK